MKFLSLNEAIFEPQDVRDQITIADIYDHRCERLVLKLSIATKHILLIVTVGICDCFECSSFPFLWCIYFAAYSFYKAMP